MPRNNIQQLQLEKGPEFILLITCILFISMFFLRNIFSYLSEFYLTYSRTGVSRDFRIQLHDKILDLPVSYFSDSRKGDVFARITSDVGEIEGNILNSLIDKRNELESFSNFLEEIILNYNKIHKYIHDEYSSKKNNKKEKQKVK